MHTNSHAFQWLSLPGCRYVLPGCDFWGYIACTGTNFCLRARSLALVGWFPEYTM